MNRVTPKLIEAVRHGSVDNKIVPSLERRRLRAYALILLVDGAIFNICFAVVALL